MRVVAAGLLLLVMVLARSAAATVADDVCPAVDDPCVVDRVVAVDAGSGLDFGARAVEIRRGGALDAGSGGFTLTAGSLRVLPGGALLGRGGQSLRTIAITTTGAVSVEGTGSTRGRIDVSGPRSGDIRISAGGTFALGGQLLARGVGEDGRGGTVVVDALTITTTPEARIVVAGGAGDFGGDVRLTALGQMTVGGEIDASGGSDGGGGIELTGSTVQLTARLDARSRVGGGDGGTIDIQSSGTIFVRGSIVSTSDCDIDDSCASTGGDVTIEATQTVLLEAPITLTGKGLDGTGGTLTVDAGLDLVQTALVLVNGTGSAGCGGEVTITAGRNVTLGAIDASGRDCDGGAVSVETPGHVTAAGQIDAGAEAGGGGSVELSGEDVVIAASVHASSDAGFGGAVTVTACGAAEVTAAADVATRGNLGENSIAAGRKVTIAGSLRAGTGVAGTGGTNELAYRSQASPPTIADGAVIVPAATLRLDAGLDFCPAPGTPECGNGVLDPGEECDDRNEDACDGCSPTCRLEGCGNGIVETDCDEECDDGNALACDGCSPTCILEGCGNGIVECTEACDAGDDNGMPGSGCVAGCVLATPGGCGNGNEDAGEGCDDGNTTACDDCSSVCQPEACGNGVVECGEECDDGNQDACDGCSATCTVEMCGDGVTECEEECDAGEANGTPGSECDRSCRIGTICGLVTDESPCIPCVADTDCDPAGRCGGAACTDGVCGQVSAPTCDDQTAGTIDRCVLDQAGAPTCEHTCINNDVCDDGDGCTVDSCAGVLGCMHTAVTGVAAINCRVSSIGGALGEHPDDAPRRLAQKLGKRLARLASQLDAAGKAEATGSTSRERKILKGVVANLHKLGKVVARAQRKGKISAELAEAIGQAANDASRAAEELRSSLQT